MPKKKLLIILGAGSSVEIGMPSVPEVDGLMTAWAYDQTLSDGIPYRPNFFQSGWNAVERHSLALHGRSGESPNFEKVLSLMLLLSNWLRPRPYGQPARELFDPSLSLQALFHDFPISSSLTNDFEPSTIVKTSLAELLERLASYFRYKCITLQENEPSALKVYTSIMTLLRQRFDIGVLSLNYDSALLHAWPEVYTGFSDKVCDDGCRYFDPGAVHRRKQWGFAYYLHGSVHFTLPDRFKSKGIFHDQIRWRDDLNGSFNDIDPGAGSILDQRSDGNDVPASTLIAGGLKLDQLLGEPFQSLYAALQRKGSELGLTVVYDFIEG